MKTISDIHSLITYMKTNEKRIYLSSDLYDWLLHSNWNCILSDNLKEYAKQHEIIRVEKVTDVKD